MPPGTSVEVVQKHHQRSGQLTAGVVSRLLTSSGFHPRGIKVFAINMHASLWYYVGDKLDSRIVEDQHPGASVVCIFSGAPSTSPA